MPVWLCPRCGDSVSSAFERNLGLLVSEHKHVCDKRQVRERCLTREDLQFLRDLKISWGEAKIHAID